MIAHLLHDLAVSGLAGLLDPTPGGGNHPVPVNGNLPGALESKLGTIMGWGLRLGYVAAFFGFVYAASKLAIAHRRGEEINFVGLGTAAAACLVLGSAGAIADALIF